jgi:LuxR family maltose regulon positive regulatory protein
MDDAKALPAFISSKLNRPTVVENHILRSHLIAKLDHSLQRPLTMVSAPAGYGKTMLVSSWLEASTRPSAWVSLDKDDNDLRVFLSYLLTAIQSCHGTGFSDVGRQTLAMVNASTLASVSTLVGSLISEIDRVEQSFVLSLDDFHLIKDKSVLDFISKLLHHPPQSLHLVLISRRDPYLPISMLRAKRLMTEIRTQDLRFNKMEIKELLTQMLGTQVDAPTVAALLEKTEGWVSGLILAVISLRNHGRLDPALLEPQVNAQYVMEYLFTEVFARQPSEIIRYMMSSAILDRFCGPLCEAACVQDPEESTREISGWEFIAWLKKENLFLIPLDTENRWFSYHHLFQRLLFNQLIRHHGAEIINELHAKASAWYAENGLIEEALKHALAGGHPETAAQLIAKHGFDLSNDEQWPRLDRWLSMLSGEVIDQNPELLVLNSWLHVIYYRYTELVSCLSKAETLLASRSDIEYVIGHINALRTWQHNIDVNGERSLTCARLAFEKLPRKHRWARMLTFLDQAAAYQMLGDRENALATLAEAIRDPDLKDGMSQGFLHATPCFIYWMDADLTAMLQTAAHSLKVAEDFQTHTAIAHGLYYMGIAHYERNELPAAEEKLSILVKKPYDQHSLNFAHGAFALALVHQARGQTDAANQVGESVVSYGLDANHPILLNMGRAFQAELAYRQGRIAEASSWAEQFVAKPFIIMHRFYVPQLTLARVLLAQNTADSREKAADLLKQLYDFVTFSHNRRFQIDVLALQALFYDFQGEEQDALKSLTNALQIAEPGGFIRPFVDLGSTMADLLKRLHRKRVARDYIEKILAAFEQEDEQGVLSDAADQTTASARQPQRPSPPSQPLIEPLTNRELDVLELLAQRLSNQEIAEKMFVSIPTVKTHLQNIYGKLGVSKRREAVEKAKNLGIL